MRYFLSRKAEEDIIAIYLYGLEHFGEAQAAKYHAQLEACFGFLAQNPYATAERLEITPPVRMHSIGVHIVIYQITDPAAFLLYVFGMSVRIGCSDWEIGRLGDWGSDPWGLTP